MRLTDREGRNMEVGYTLKGKNLSHPHLALFNLAIASFSSVWWQEKFGSTWRREPIIFFLCVCIHARMSVLVHLSVYYPPSTHQVAQKASSFYGTRSSHAKYRNDNRIHYSMFSKHTSLKGSLTKSKIDQVQQRKKSNGCKLDWKKKKWQDDSHLQTASEKNPFSVWACEYCWKV